MVNIDRISETYCKELLKKWEQDKNSVEYSYILVTNDNGTFTAIDNASNEFFMEDFKTEEDAINYLCGKDLEEETSEFIPREVITMQCIECGEIFDTKDLKIERDSNGEYVNCPSCNNMCDLEEEKA